LVDGEVSGKIVGLFKALHSIISNPSSSMCLLECSPDVEWLLHPSTPTTCVPLCFLLMDAETSNIGTLWHYTISFAFVLVRTMYIYILYIVYSVFLNEIIWNYSSNE
jgi:hypothetical protein